MEMLRNYQSYDSALSIWLSVDPMSDKYPSMSPYNYCANNPVMLVDPDGREWEAYNKDGVLLATGGDANDHRQFVVMSEEDALRITDKKNVDIDNVESAVQIPDNKTINEVLDYAEKEDTKQNNREYKGWITLVNDIHRMVECIPGLPVNVCAGESGNTGSYMDLDPKYTKNDLYGAWAHFHTHYSKTCPINYIYPSQEPTKGSDELNVMRPGSIVKSSFVIMMRDKNVYLLNKNGDQGFIPFDKFRQLGK